MLLARMQAPAADYGGTYQDVNGVSYAIPQTGILAIPLSAYLGAVIAGFRDIDDNFTDQILSSPGLAIGSTDKNVANVAFTFQIGANTARINTFLSKAAVAAGTAPAAGTIPTSAGGLWGLLLYYITAAGTIASVWTPASIVTGYASEAAARADYLAAVALVPVGSAMMGDVTIQAAATHTWVAGTDSLAGGASGNVAQATHYNNAGVSYGALY